MLVRHLLRARSPDRASAGWRCGAVLTRALLASAAILLMGCASDDVPEARSIEAQAVAIAHLDGQLIWTEQAGAVHVENRGQVLTVPVASEGQQGLVGLATTAEGRVFAGFTRPDERLTVAELDLDSGEVLREVWVGPSTGRGGLGGRLRILDDGRLLFSVGLLSDRASQADPDSIVGKLIALDPDGEIDQQPEILSGPWNNAFAFDQAARGELWVADNHPQDGDERVARGDQGFGPDVVAVLPNDSAPTGLLHLGADETGGSEELWICSYNTQRLLRIQLDDGLAVVLDEVDDVASDCLLDLIAIDGVDGDPDLIAYSSGQTIEVIER